MLIWNVAGPEISFKAVIELIWGREKQHSCKESNGNGLMGIYNQHDYFKWTQAY